MSDISLVVLLPFLAATLAAALPRRAASVGLLTVALNVVLVLNLCRQIFESGPVVQTIGGWSAPLGIAFVADGLAGVMLAMTAVVGFAVSLQVAAGPLRRGFWPLWMATLGALNGLFLSSDLFNLYVAFEILGLAAVGLTALAGTPVALRAAFDYLTAGLVGSLLVLLGIALSYSVTGRVDLDAVALLTQSGTGRLALSLIAAGLVVKAALFPLHFWMPAAHSSAAPAASALLSALVVKGALYLALRLSIEGGAGADFLRSTLVLLGAGGMLWGAWNALRAERLKLLVAHSTVAQIGLIALAVGAAGDPLQTGLWQAAALLMLSHALAKGAMFLAVGRIAEALGHDRISGLNREALRPGPAEFAFAIAAISLVGLPPTAGFIGKWILIEGLIDTGAAHWIALILLGTALSAAYLSRVVSRCLRGGPHVAATAHRPPWRTGDVAALGLATCALLLGLAAALPLSLLEATTA